MGTHRAHAHSSYFRPNLCGSWLNVTVGPIAMGTLHDLPCSLVTKQNFFFHCVFRSTRFSISQLFLALGESRTMRFHIRLCVCFLALLCEQAVAQVYPPGAFSVDGYPVSCFNNTFVLTSQLNDVGMNNGRGTIFLNPSILNSMPTVLKMYWVGHECGHSAVGPSEPAADCWSIRTGRNQGWFPPQAFSYLYQMFKDSPGDMAHGSGMQRLQNMLNCYQQP